jgi:hypothetical protein
VHSPKQPEGPKLSTKAREQAAFFKTLEGEIDIEKQIDKEL